MQQYQHHHSIIEIYFIHCLRMIQIVSQYLWLAGSFIFFLLGYVQLSSFFFIPGNSTHEKNSKREEKENKETNLFYEPSILKSRMGFSLKHSIVSIYFGAMNLILAGGYFIIVKQSYIIMITTLGISLFYFCLSKLYWTIITRFFLLVANCFFVTASIFLAISR